MTGLSGALRKLLFTQALLIAVTAGGFFAVQGPAAAGAAIYGGLIALTNVAVLAAFWRRAERTAGSDVNRNLRLLYGSALARFFVVTVLFVVGIGALHLAPLAALVGFIAGQAALVLNRIQA